MAIGVGDDFTYDLSPVRDQAIISTGADAMPIAP